MNGTKVFDKIAINELKSQSDILADKIKKMIVSQELAEGYQFPNENDFCRILNVGRGTLREAYKILDTQGYLKRTKHGTFVRKKEDVAREGNFLASLELADYDELAEFICAMEPEAVYLATKRMTGEEFQQIEKLAKECKKRYQEGQRLSEINHQFHSAIWNVCGNQLIISSLMAYYDTFHQRVLQPVYADEVHYDKFIQEALTQHDELMDALRKKDADTARKVSYEHLLADLKYRKFLKNY